MSPTDVIRSNAHWELEKLVRFARDLPAPAAISRSEMEAALAIFERLVTPAERKALVGAAARMRSQNILLLIVALMRFLEKRSPMNVREVEELVSRRQTIVGIVLE